MQENDGNKNNYDYKKDLDNLHEKKIAKENEIKKLKKE